MANPVDHTGVRFGRLVALSYVGKSIWRCVCDCGTEKLISSTGLVHGGTKSCGCLLRDITAARSTKHGHSRRGRYTNIYRRWGHMTQRCHNPADGDYPRYGGRGITVCDRWRFGDGERTGFECFLVDMGMPPDRSYSIDRIDSTGPYSPDNCRWATTREQNNNRSNTVMLTVDGVTKPRSVWCEEYGLSKQAYMYRVNRMGMTPKQALTTPLTWTKEK
jgi:hypothetical protein